MYTPCRRQLLRWPSVILTFLNSSLCVILSPWTQDRFSNLILMNKIQQTTGCRFWEQATTRLASAVRALSCSRARSLWWKPAATVWGALGRAHMSKEASGQPPRRTRSSVPKSSCQHQVSFRKQICPAWISRGPQLCERPRTRGPRKLSAQIADPQKGDRLSALWPPRGVG